MGHKLFELAQLIFSLAHRLTVKAEAAAMADVQKLEAEISKLNLEKYAHIELQAKANKFKTKLEDFLNV